ncbi:MAG: PD40 domain-containing protein [Planctomycetes bacterium]|nr:PD40 domain-containing protein [Planctomycetota bacterium]
MLTLYSDRHAPNSGDYDLYVATRENPGDEFGPAVNFRVAYPGSGISSPFPEFAPRMSCDRLAIYFSSDRPGGKGGFDLYAATRDSPGGFFGNVRNLGNVNTEAHEFSPVVSRDGLTLFFSDYIPPFRERGLGGGDIWMVTRESTEEEWKSENVRNLGWLINSEYGDFDFFVSHDWPAEGSTIWFTSDRRQERLGNENCKNSAFADVIWDADIYTATWIPARPFRRGDADEDGAPSLTDAVIILLYLFAGGPEPSCLKTADVTDTGSLNITDPVYLLLHLFRGWPAPPEPFRTCGPDPSEDFYTLSCNSYTACQ